jgi:small subunit ribosomal protein S5
MTEVVQIKNTKPSSLLHKVKQAQEKDSEFEEKVIQVSRVSKKTKGGNKMGFSILMVVGDRKGRVGVGLGKSKDVMSAIRKGVKKAKKKMINVPLDGTTIPFSITTKLGSGKVLLKPAPKGSGVIAGGPVRAVVEAAGIRDISSKIMGSGNPSVSVYATFEALNQISKIVTLKGIKLKSIAEIEREEAKKLRELSEHEKAKSEAKMAKEKAEKAVAQKAAAPKAEAKPAAKKEVKTKPDAKVEKKN